MHTKIVLHLFFLVYFTGLNAQKAFLKEVLPIKDVWSLSLISPDYSKVFLRFKGKENTLEIVQFSNVGAAQLRDTSNWEVLKEFDNVRFAWFSPDNTMLSVIFGNDTACIVDLEKSIVVKQFANVWKISFSPDSRLMRIIYNDKTQFLDTNSWNLIKEFENTERLITDFSPDSKQVGVAFTDGTVHLVETEGWNTVQTFTDVANWGLSFSPDNTYMVLTHNDSRAELLTKDDWQTVKEFNNSKWLRFGGAKDGATYSENNIYLWNKLTDDTLYLFDVKTFQIVLEKQDVLFLSITRDEKYLYLIFNDMSCQVINLESNEIVLQDLQNVEECVFLSTKRIAIALQDEIRIYQLD